MYEEELEKLCTKATAGASDLMNCLHEALALCQLARNDNRQLKHEVILARKWAEETVAATVAARVVTCVYCAHEFPHGTPASQAEQLTAHVKVCEKHPVRAAEARIAELESAIRAHRDVKGTDRCHLDDGALYAVLRDGASADQTLPPEEAFLSDCKRFYDLRKSGVDTKHCEVLDRVRELEQQRDEARGQVETLLHILDTTFKELMSSIQEKDQILAIIAQKRKAP